MHFRDQSHIDQVRDALWKRNGDASVMIGSGFSRNAYKNKPDADDLPTWGELGSALKDKLYPQGDGLSGGRNNGQTPAVDNVLRLAQEYDAAFGRLDLHRFLRQLIRDEDYKPGEAHARLLQLPWRDIFTTNWDTLLERGGDAVAERNYGIVRKAEEIPLANRPRIVKLHGSFPAHFPLVVTEEDYRTYPTKSAPLVNTVQQAMMETVFCLIGFSGDDPNFLHWSGWVRDNLGDSAPKIYLAGWLNLSPHIRRMLEDRNVVPIDLAHHPQVTKWPENRRHRYAIDWILHTLERGRPYDVTIWPSREHRRYSSIPDDLQPVHELDLLLPQDEPTNQPEIDDEDLPNKVSQTIRIWSHNREIYPDWLALPASARQLVSLCTNAWDSGIRRALSHFEPIDQLNAIRELVWRKGILMDPISSELESAADGVLKRIDCHGCTIDGVAVTDQFVWGDIRKVWVDVGLALLTCARQRFDCEVFNLRIDALKSFSDDDSNIAHRIHHEQCLWAIYSMGFEDLENSLKDWQTENCDPVWMLRKAAILYELNRTSDAVELFEQALLDIRGMSYDNRSLAGPSREGWALFLAWALEWSRWMARDGEDLPSEVPFSRRWRELASLKCDALSERDEFVNAIKGKTQEADAPAFDLDVRTRRGFVLSNERYNRWVSARRAVRLSEIAGLPNYTSGVLKPAIDELSKSEPELAVRLVLRVLNYDGDPVLKRVLSRTNVARLHADTAKGLADACDRLITFSSPRLFKTGRLPRSIFWIERMRVAVEVLSRLVLRLEPKRVETIFGNAMKLYQDPQVAQEPWLIEPAYNLLRRSWEALSIAQREERILDVLGTPISGMAGFMTDSSHYRDPSHLLDDSLLPPLRSDQNEHLWHGVIETLVRALGTGGQARKRASIRVASIALWKRPNEAEVVELAQALWAEQHLDGYGLPTETDLLDWVFMLLPEPMPGMAEEIFRRKWLSDAKLSQKNSPNLDDSLWEVGRGIAELKTHGHSFAISDQERSYLIDVVKQWSTRQAPPRFDLPVETEDSASTRRAVGGLRTVLSEVRIPEDTAEKLFNKVQELNVSKIPAFGLTAGLVRAMPHRIDDIAHAMRTGLASQDESLAENAAAGLHHWLMVSAGVASQIHTPPEDLVREIGVIIAARRKETLALALKIAKWVFDEGNDSQKEAIGRLALQGLGYLIEELRYDREHDLDLENDIPELRWRSAEIAVSMARSGYGDDSNITRWLKVAEEDPMPEVRYIRDLPYFRGPDNEERDGHNEEGTGSPVE